MAHSLPRSSCSCNTARRAARPLLTSLFYLFPLGLKVFYRCIVSPRRPCLYMCTHAPCGVRCVARAGTGKFQTLKMYIESYNSPPPKKKKTNTKTGRCPACGAAIVYVSCKCSTEDWRTPLLRFAWLFFVACKHSNSGPIEQTSLKA